MTVTTNTLGSNSAEIVVTGPESYLNVAGAVQTFLLAHGWSLVPDSTPSATVTATASTGSPANQLTVSSTTGFVVGMPVQFTGTTFGGLATSTTYYILQIVDSTHVTISTTSSIQNAGVTAFVVSTASGTCTMQSRLAGLSGNSTGNRQRVYYAYNLTGFIYKFIRLNLYDLTIDTAEYYTSSTTGVVTYMTGTNPAFRQCHFAHASYPRDYYINNTGSPTAATANALSIASPTWNRSNNSNNIPTGNFGASGASTVVYGTNAGLPVYPNMQVMAYSISSGNYAVGCVIAYTDSTGTVQLGNIFGANTSPPMHHTAIGTAYSDWVVLWPGTLNYNNSVNPCYVYISATSRHCCIQTRNTDGQWNDWISVTEFENPLAIANGRVNGVDSTTQHTVGLTTGFMSGNSGYIDWINGGNGSNTATGSPTDSVYAGYTGNTGTATGSSMSSGGGSPISGAVNITYGFGGTSTAYTYSNTVGSNVAASFKGGKFVPFMGPMSCGVTYQGRTGALASQTSKLVTPLGEAGFGGSIYRQVFQGGTATVTPTVTLTGDIVFTYWFKGMGDVMSSQINTAAGTKHFAVTPIFMSDFGGTGASSFATFSDTQCRIDDFVQHISNASTQLNVNGYLKYSQTAGPWTSPRSSYSYRVDQPTPMGRIYGIKYVTTGLSTLNTISIKVDASGFVSNSGSATDHIVFSYPGSYVSTDVNTNIAPTPIKPTQTWTGVETLTNQANTRTSQSVAVAFPK